MEPTTLLVVGAAAGTLAVCPYTTCGELGPVARLTGGQVVCDHCGGRWRPASAPRYYGPAFSITAALGVSVPAGATVAEVAVEATTFPLEPLVIEFKESLRL